MKFLITGGLGYLGSMLTKKLLEDNHKVTVFDKGVYGVSHISSLLNDKNLKLIIGDVRDEIALQKVVRESDIIIHLAALVGAPLVKRKKIEAEDVNIEGTKVITKLVSTNQKLFFASSGSTYGKVDGICDENHEISPLSEYGLHKKIGEEITSEKDSLCMRFATVYGLSFRTRNDLYINSMIQKALIDRSVVLYEGDAKRTFAHVEDIADSIVFLSKLEDRISGPLNIGDSRLSFSKRQICNKISEKTEFNILENDFAKDLDQRDYEVSYKKFEALGFTFKKDFNESLDGMIEYYDALFSVRYDN